MLFCISSTLYVIIALVREAFDTRDDLAESIDVWKRIRDQHQPHPPAGGTAACMVRLLYCCCCLATRTEHRRWRYVGHVYWHNIRLVRLECLIAVNIVEKPDNYHIAGSTYYRALQLYSYNLYWPYRVQRCVYLHTYHSFLETVLGCLTSTDSQFVLDTTTRF